MSAFSLGKRCKKTFFSPWKEGTKIFFFPIAVACHLGLFSQRVPAQTGILIESRRSPAAAVIVGVARGSETPGVTQMSALFPPRRSFQTQARAARERW